MSMPPSSPRLPSPPPPAEIQIGPKSPLMAPNAARQVAQIEQTAIDTNAKRRIHPGTKSADMAAGPPLVPLHELDSAFQLQEHLAALHYYHTSSHTSPITRETAKLLATPPPGIDKTLWLYELCRFLIAQCNSLIVGFLFDTPPCSAATCPEMRASEWQFLCAVHDSPKSCCAIDYCCHTLDWAANVVTNPKIFPSRFVVDAHDKNTAIKNLVNVFRRLHRIFAHAWFQHRGVFWAVEGQTGLYVFFKTVCDVYDLLPAENYKLPPEAEGLDSNVDARVLESSDRRHQQTPSISIAKPAGHRAENDEDNYPSMSRTNTRRHIKSSPSTGSAVTTVPEADEDDDGHLSNKLGQMRISAPPAAAAFEELELATIPVMVEQRPQVVAEQPVRPSSVIPPSGTVASEPQQEMNPEPEVSVTELSQPPEPESESQPQPEPEVEFAPESESQGEPETTQPPATTEEQPTVADEPPITKEPGIQGGNEPASLDATAAGNDSSSEPTAKEAEANSEKTEEKDEASLQPPPSSEPAVQVDEKEPGPAAEPQPAETEQKADKESEAGKDVEQTPSEESESKGEEKKEAEEEAKAAKEAEKPEDK